MTSIAVFGSSATVTGSEGWAEAERLGRAIAERGWAVATGGYGGTMEAVSAGAASAGGRVIGVTAPSVFPSRDGANPHVSEELVELTISGRIARLVELSDAVIALPGSIGTLAELIVSWNAAFVAPFRGEPALPVVAVGDAWEVIIDVIHSTLPTGAGFVHVAPTALDALTMVDAMIDGIEDEGF